MEITKNSSGRVYEELLLERGLPRGETRVIPDEPDAVDADDVLRGLGVDGWLRDRRVRRVGSYYLVVSGD